MSSVFSVDEYSYPKLIQVHQKEGCGTTFAFDGYFYGDEPKTFLLEPRSTLLVGTQTDRVHLILVNTQDAREATMQAVLTLLDFAPIRDDLGINRLHCLEALSQVFAEPERAEYDNFELKPNYDDLHAMLNLKIRQ
jgi:hypothetical protein